MQFKSAVRATAATGCTAILALAIMSPTQAAGPGPGDAVEHHHDHEHHATAPTPESLECVAVDDDGNLSALAPGTCSVYGPAGNQTDQGQARNVILFIGDGMGDSEITSARNYLEGADGSFAGIDALQQTGQYTTFSMHQDDEANALGLPNYVPDSAATGTGWASGVKTYNGAIGVDPEGDPHENLLETAKANGMRTGNVTTSEIQDATPAVLGSHALHRKCYGPEEAENDEDCQGEDFAGQYRENGGLGSISEQLVETRADVTMGGGAEAFQQIVQEGGEGRNPFLPNTTEWEEGVSVQDNAEANGFQVITDAEELDAVTVANQDTPLLGLFADGNIPRIFEETVPTSDGATSEPQRCNENPERTDEMPHLAQMTSKSIELLDDPSSPSGFFLQVESASVDKANHEADACGQIGEMQELDDAVQVARDWAQQSGQETLIVVTADHAHTSQIVPYGQDTVGLTTSLLTADDAPMTIGYATAETNDEEDALGGQNHTGAQVRIAAEGPGASNVLGRTDQTDLHFTILNSLGLNASGNSTRMVAAQGG